MESNCIVKWYQKEMNCYFLYKNCGVKYEVHHLTFKNQKNVLLLGVITNQYIQKESIYFNLYCN
jgi:hypothetical protein